MTDYPVAHRSPETEPREALRVELLLQLPELGADFEANALVLDEDYDQAALADWILDQVDVIRRDAIADATRGLEALEQDQAEIIELASATATFTAMAEWSRYLGQIPAVLRRGLSIRDAHDLAATVEAEHARVIATLTALAERFPALRTILGEAVGVRAQGLVNAAGIPIEP